MGEPLDLDDDGPDPVLERRRRNRKRAARRNLLVAGGVAAAVVVAGLLWWGLGRGGVAESASDSWTMADMRDHLRARGCNVWMFPHKGAAYFVFADSEAEADEAMDWVRGGGGLDRGIVRCTQFDSRQRARESAGMDPDREFAWGRFVFCGERGKDGAEYMDRVHRALTGRPHRR